MWKKIHIAVNRDLYDVVIDEFSDLDNFCKVLGEYILNKYPSKLVKTILRYNYGYFSRDESDEIIKLAVSEFKYDLDLIIAELKDYIINNDILIIDGFVMFRLADMVCVAENIVEDVIGSIISRYKYNEFISLLKFFMEIQTPEINTVHIINYKDRYIIMDSKFDDITDECIDEFFAEINCGSINYDDVLLSALVTLAPKHIYIHSVLKNKELSVTLKKIFNKRIVFCDSANYDNYSVQNAIIGVKEKNYGNISKLSILSQIKSDL